LEKEERKTTSSAEILVGVLTISFGVFILMRKDTWITKTIDLWPWPLSDSQRDFMRMMWVIAGIIVIVFGVAAMLGLAK
jgi:hypothetical protein